MITRIEVDGHHPAATACGHCFIGFKVFSNHRIMGYAVADLKVALGCINLEFSEDEI